MAELEQDLEYRQNRREESVDEWYHSRSLRVSCVVKRVVNFEKRGGVIGE